MLLCEANLLHEYAPVIKSNTKLLHSFIVETLETGNVEEASTASEERGVHGETDGGEEVGDRVCGD